MYDDMTVAFTAAQAQLATINAQLVERSPAIRKAVQLDPATGAVKVNAAALSKALQPVVPPAGIKRGPELARILELGFAMHDDGSPVVPWGALIDPRVYTVFDAVMWDTLGFDAAGGNEFAQVADPPAVVKNNTDVLRKAAAAPPEYPLASDHTRSAIARAPWIGNHAGQHWLEAIQPDPAPTPAADPATPPDQTSSTQQHIDVSKEQLDKAISCFTKAQWSLEWYGVRICLGKDCVDFIAGLIFSTGSAIVVAAVAEAIKAAALSAALAACGGWVGLAILLSAFYWAVWLLAAKGPNGACIHIPGPWTLGLMGPGWVTPIN